MKKLLLAFVLCALPLLSQPSFKWSRGLPRQATAPSTCNKGEFYFNSTSNRAYYCSATDTWSIIALRSAYGQLYENSGGTVINITTGGTFYQWVSSTAGLSSLTTPAVDTDNITIDAGGGGLYSIAFQVSYEGNGNEIYHWAVFVEGAERTEVSSERKIAANDQGSQSGVGLVALSATDVVDLRVTSTTNTKTATVKHVQLVITRIGP